MTNLGDSEPQNPCLPQLTDWDIPVIIGTHKVEEIHLRLFGLCTNVMKLVCSGLTITNSSISL